MKLFAAVVVKFKQAPPGTISLILGSEPESWVLDLSPALILSGGGVHLDTLTHGGKGLCGIYPL